jgi:hypothetical protein
MRYFITFACYGAHRHNLFGGRSLEADPQRAAAERRRVNQPPFEMDGDSRAVVLQSLAEVCWRRGSKLTRAEL